MCRSIRRYRQLPENGTTDGKEPVGSALGEAFYITEYFIFAMCNMMVQLTVNV